MSTSYAPQHPAAHPRRRRASLATALSIALVAASSACIVQDGSPSSSPIDGRLAPPPSPSIDVLFDLVFPNVACTDAPSGIGSWRVVLDSQPLKDSGVLACFDDANHMPFAVRFPDLRGGADYTLEVFGYPWDAAARAPSTNACWTARCTATTTRGPAAVLPRCTVSRTC